MNLSATCNRLGLVGTIALFLGPLGASSQADMIPWTAGYGYSSYYAPTAGYGYGYTTNYGYTANYGGYGGGGCCLLNLFGCCGLFGHGGYTAAYAPTYQYAPSYCAPACDPCGGSCGPYGSCGSCGTSGYSMGGTWGSTGCPSGDCGIPAISSPGTSPSPYSGEPVNPPSSSPPTYAPPQTHPESGDDGFRRPQPIPGTGGGGGGGLFPPDDGPSSSNSPEAAPSGVSPAGGGIPDPQIERNDGGFQLDSFKIPARDRAEDEAEEEEDDDGEDDVNDDESRVIIPLQIDAVAAGVTPQRRRAHYRAVFRTPSVARTQIPGQSEWEALDDVPRLANSDK